MESHSLAAVVYFYSQSVCICSRIFVPSQSLFSKVYKKRINKFIEGDIQKSDQQTNQNVVSLLGNEI